MRLLSAAGYTSRLDEKSHHHDRYSWHGAAFIVEALLLLAFLVGALAVFMVLTSSALKLSSEAEDLSYATVIASNEAEEFAADPALFATEKTHAFRISDEAINPVSITELTTDDFAATHELTTDTQASGILYRDHISVSHSGQVIYELDTASYVSNSAKEVA